MTNLQTGLLVVAGSAAVFALAGGFLAALERAPGLRGSTWRGRSPTRTVALAELVGALAIIATGLALRAWFGEARGLLMASAGVGLLVHAVSAFVASDVTRQRVANLGWGLLALSMAVWGYLGRR